MDTPGPYTLNKIADELTDIALGKAYYGGALRAAKDIFKDPQDVALLERFMTGLQRSADHLDLQQLANELRVKDFTEKSMRVQKSTMFLFHASELGITHEVTVTPSRRNHDFIVHIQPLPPAEGIRGHAAMLLSDCLTETLADRAPFAQQHCRLTNTDWKYLLEKIIRVSLGKDLTEPVRRRRGAEVYTVGRISTSHITKESEAFLRSEAQNKYWILATDHGYLLRLWGEVEDNEEFFGDIAEEDLAAKSEIMALLLWAFNQGFEMLELDCDGPTLKNLPTWSW